MEFARTPRWELPIPEAIALQRELAAQVRLDSPAGPVELVAGVDLAFTQDGELGRGVAVVWRLSDGAVLEEVVEEAPVRFPYVPGLLAFREGPLVEAALRALRTEPDLVMVDGQGIAHPRGLGIAAHLGVLLDCPTIGIGKSRLYGRAAEPGPHPGDRQPLLTPKGVQIGVLLRTRERCNPLYVSPGNHVDPDRAGDLVFECLRGHRLPEPVFLADKLSKRR